MGPQLAFKAVGIGLQMPFPVRAANCILIRSQLFRRAGIGKLRPVFIRDGKQRVGQPQLLNAVILLCHGIGLPLPLAKFPRHADLAGIGRPNGEMPIQLLILPHGMRP